MFRILIQRRVKTPPAPSVSDLRRWAKLTLQDKISAAEMTIRIVGEKEITTLNATYRHKNKPTNVLSFPFEMPCDVVLDIPIIGDLVICAQVVAQEAHAQKKSLQSHWAHMVVHGTLHLLGFDHETESDAAEMEGQEIKILSELGFSDPYQIHATGK